MSGQVRRSFALALVGLLAGLGLVAALFGGDSLRQLTGRPVAERTAPPEPGDHARALAEPGTLTRKPDPSLDIRDDKSGQAASGAAPGAGRASEPARDAHLAASGPAGKPVGKAAGADAVPRFDIVRVEPNGDTVVAGQGAPHAVVEMLVNGKPVARATADAGGQFAVVPPALPAGSSQIRLRMTGKDGQSAESEQSVAVDVAPGRDRQPLVALTAPDAPTVVLSQPGGPGSDAKVAGAGASGTGQPTRIASVDVQENGRLFVTVTGTPGAALRLYLNDTLIAPGRIGPDGRASFTIGRGMKPGAYQVRVDQIAPETGKVETRAEVPLSVPEPARVAARAPADARTSRGPGSAHGGDQAGGPAGDPGGGQATGRTTGQGSAQAHGPSGAKDRGPGSARAVPELAGTPRPAASAPPSPDTRRADADGQAAGGAVYVPEISTAKITRGDNLWRISQRTYGRGERYTVIYDANQTQIRNPDLIYPGQIFVLPADKRG
ncbi:LysM domain-containing protein [Methylobacterium phyllostachyos]|uniref:LysM domain-containing protein n=1 Tax=Methylobacterium phyllostachyos TaxID=582672 RepID=A0A1H0IWX9_9HYPH|nr:LysM peptidoglycan-binding domain-containing protein [Methylobacterium phyllostachyos]SDO36014.1 LysM domain-containing protein [Methylobacterium phyllostachyos]